MTITLERAKGAQKIRTSAVSASSALELRRARKTSVLSVPLLILGHGLQGLHGLQASGIYP